MITIRRYSKAETETGDRSRFNVNNLWAETDAAPPDDYDSRLERTQTKHWIHLSNKNPRFIDFDAEDTKWMLQALNAYALLVMMGTNELQVASTVSTLYKEQLDKTIAKHSVDFPNGSWFVRVERISLKTGVHGPGPYNNLKNVIQSIITSKVGHECISLSDNLERFRVYFLEWREIEHEFRVFVHNDVITAISTQRVTEIDGWVQQQNDEELSRNVVGWIDEAFNQTLKDKLGTIVGPDYTMDIGLLEDGSVYFIEPNCFGAQYAAASALFHWTDDHAVLHDTKKIEFRFVDRDVPVGN